MNRRKVIFIVFCISYPAIHLFAHPEHKSAPGPFSGDYSIVIEGYDWGPAVSKVILSLDQPDTTADVKAFTVAVTRNTELTELSPEEASGTRTVLYTYVSVAEARLRHGRFYSIPTKLLMQLFVFQYSRVW